MNFLGQDSTLKGGRFQPARSTALATRPSQLLTWISDQGQDSMKSATATPTT